MKRCLLWLPLCVVVLVPAVVAEDPPRQPSVAEQARQFQRNRELIQMLVQEGLRLASEEDPLKRAEVCNAVAECLANAIRQAAENREKARVAELGQHLHALLEQGVAANLNTARAQIPVGSTQEKALKEIRDRATELVLPLVQQLQQTADPEDNEELHHTLKVLHDGRAEVERALTTHRHK